MSHPRIVDEQTIRSYWERVATWYDGDLLGANRDATARSLEELRAWQLLFFRILGPPPLQVLDVGTGTGYLALMLAELGYYVTAVDSAAAMVLRTRAKAARAGFDVAVQQGFAGQLPFKNHSFDAVVSRLVLWSQPQPEQTVREWVRVTRPGGKVATIDTLHQHRRAPLRWLRQWCAQRLVEARGKPAGFLDDPYALAQLPLGWLNDIETFRNVFVRAGLSSVLIERLDGVHALEQRSMPLALRLWPTHAPVVVEGTVRQAQGAERHGLGPDRSDAAGA